MNDPVEELSSIAPGLLERLGQVRGVEGVALGGSRARGTHTPASDYDLGIYYRQGLEVESLQALADEYSTVSAPLTEPGGWGPWVDGGGWLIVGDVHVDFIYRNIARVTDVWGECCQGRYVNEVQAGHPLGFWSHAYVGELALALPAGTWSTNLSELREATAEYPLLLSEALTASIWEASFSIANASKATKSGDVAFVAGCLFRAAGVMAHALHGRRQQWLINEKGAIASAAALPAAPSELAERVASSFARLSADPADLMAACRELQAVVEEATNAMVE
ncbi:MAG: nucleotidyltransferase domain-containing protein [Acidimicrobiia bacterium]|nr:nucleotidyltransferase domain-containing protein [Acidimicrobiia bacterium]